MAVIKSSQQYKVMPTILQNLYYIIFVSSTISLPGC